jgi:methionine sulfoxide reductase heme-binding subunit
VPTINRLKPKITWLQGSIHILGWLPLAWLIFEFFSGRLSVNPVQDIEQFLGRTAVAFLLASLACSPLYTVSSWREPLKRRRALGLYSFLYASLHVLAFIGLDYGFNLPWIGGIILKKTYAIAGLATFLILLPLAVTSFPIFQRRMGRKWTTLHRFVYLAGVLAILHYAWASKGSLFALQGDILKPLLAGLLLLLLLVLRLPRLRRRISGWRHRAGSIL